MTAPTTLEELYKSYHGMVVSLARKSGIDECDVEDAAQNIEFRFWNRGGLTWYDPDKLFDAPPEGWHDGSQLDKRTATFGSMYRRYVAKSMLGEAERIANQRKSQGYPVDWTNPESYAATVSGDVADAICDEDAFASWLADSIMRLRARGWGDYVELFTYVSRVAMEGDTPAKEEIARLIGPHVTVSMALTTLQRAVKQVGIEKYGD